MASVGINGAGARTSVRFDLLFGLGANALLSLVDRAWTAVFSVAATPKDPTDDHSGSHTVHAVAQAISPGS